MGKPPFVHLHMHYEGSLADSALRVKEAAAKAKALEMKYLAITDHGFMHWVVPFYKACKDEGVNPIIGMETYVAPRGNLLKEHGIDDANHHLVLLCENNTGYQNLIQIASNAALDGFYYKPRTDKKTLQQYHEGIISLSACLGGSVQQYLLQGKYQLAKEEALQYDEIFGRGNFFLELQDHGMPEQAPLNPQLIRLSRETGIPLVATNDCHYLDRTSFEAHDILMAIQGKTTIMDTKRKKYPSDEFYFKTQEEMWSLFGYIPEALENTVKIAERCHVDFVFGVNKIPKFKVPPPYTAVSFLREKVEEGALDRYGEITPEIRERIEYEFGVVTKMEYTDYFLIMWDLFDFARRKNIFCSPGRGSGGGSILLYSLYVTHLDPIKYELMFERFLDVNRISMPDYVRTCPLVWKRISANLVNLLQRGCAA